MTPVSKMLTFNCFVSVCFYTGFQDADVRLLCVWWRSFLRRWRSAVHVTTEGIMTHVSKNLTFIWYVRVCMYYSSFPWSWSSSVTTECIMTLVSIKLDSNCYVSVYFDARFQDVGVLLLCQSILCPSLLWSSHQSVLWRTLPWNWRSTFNSECTMTLLS